MELRGCEGGRERSAGPAPMRLYSGGGAHRRTEPEVSTRALLGSAGGEVGGSAQGLAEQQSSQLLHGQISENRSPTASRQFF